MQTTTTTTTTMEAPDFLCSLQFLGNSKVTINQKTRHVHLTYLGHHPQGCNYVISTLQNNIRNHGVTTVIAWSYVEENGKCRIFNPPQTHPHTHVALALDFVQGLRITTIQVFAIDGFLPHIRAVEQYAHWKYILTVYHGKEQNGTWRVSNSETAIYGSWSVQAMNAFGDAIGQVITNSESSRADVVRACVNAGKIGLTNAALTAHDQLSRPAPLPPNAPEQLYPWQEYLIQMIKTGMPSERSVIWVCDPLGGSGKSALGKAVQAEGGLLFTTAEPKTVSYILREWLDANRGKFPSAFVIDLARATEPHDSLYTTLECLKNGNFTSSKYTCQELSFPVVPVIVTSNQLPNLSRLTLSRWVLHLRGISGRTFAQTYYGQPDGALHLMLASNVCDSSTYGRLTAFPAEGSAETWQQLKQVFDQLYAPNLLEYWQRGLQPEILWQTTYNRSPLGGAQEFSSYVIQVREFTAAEYEEFEQFKALNGRSREQVKQETAQVDKWLAKIQPTHTPIAL